MKPARIWLATCMACILASGALFDAGRLGLGAAFAVIALLEFTFYYRAREWD